VGQRAIEEAWRKEEQANSARRGDRSDFAFIDLPETLRARRVWNSRFPEREDKLPIEMTAQEQWWAKRSLDEE
jgi:hypothetical protein